jgi:hypothetical protein
MLNFGMFCESINIKAGIKKQFADSPAEAKILYVVKELRTPRVLIAPKVWKSGIAPTESVQMTMIEPAK